MQEAFGRNVVAFLNKDNYETRLAEIISKYEQELSNVLEIQQNGETRRLEQKYVMYIQASDKYSAVYYRQPADIKTDYLLSGYTLSRWQEILPEDQFCRVARNVILNYGNVKKIDRNMVYMTDDKFVLHFLVLCVNFLVVKKTLDKTVLLYYCTIQIIQ